MVEKAAETRKPAEGISAADDLTIIPDGDSTGGAAVAESAIAAEEAFFALPRTKIEPPQVHGWLSRVPRWSIGLASSVLVIGFSVVLFFGSGQPTGEPRRTLVFVALAASLNLVLNLRGIVDAVFGGPGSWARISRLGNDIRMASIAWGAMSVFFTVAFMTDGRIASGDLRNANALLETTVVSIENSHALIERLETSQVSLTNSNEIAILLDPWDRAQSFWNTLSSTIEMNGRELAHAEHAASIGKIHGEVLIVDDYTGDLLALQSSIQDAQAELIGFSEFAQGLVGWSIGLGVASLVLSIAFYIFYRWNREPELVFFLRSQNYLDYERAYDEVHRRLEAKEPLSSELLELVGFQPGRTARDDRWLENCEIEDSWLTKKPQILGNDVAGPPLAALRTHLGITWDDRVLGSKSSAQLLQPFLVIGGLSLPTIAALLSSL